MSGAGYLLAAVFLPLLPLSMAFNALFARLRNAPLRAALLLGWPQLGVFAAVSADSPAPDWVLGLALFTSGLYAFRAIVLRDMAQWIGYLATSAWALLWIPIVQGEPEFVRLFALGFSLPLALLVLLGAYLERGFGAAYTGLYGGLASALPCFSAMLVIVVLACMAVPLFPGFFAMLALIVFALPTTPWWAVAVAVVWVLWSWAGIRLLQGLVVGPAQDTEVADIGATALSLYAAALVVLIIGGIYLAGALR